MMPLTFNLAFARQWLDAAKLNQRFVLDKLQDADGTVYDSARNRTVQRLYNYPWVAQLHLELVFLLQAAAIDPELEQERWR